MNNKNSIFLNCEFNLNKLNINCYKYSKIDGKIDRQIGSEIYINIYCIYIHMYIYLNLNKIISQILYETIEFQMIQCSFNND